jgi:hypothetical protein
MVPILLQYKTANYREMLLLMYNYKKNAAH